MFFAATARAAVGVWENTGGPIGGLGYNIRIHPTNKNLLFQTDAFSGVHRSTDGGQTWVEANTGIDARVGPSNDAIPVFSLTIDARNPNTIWVGTQGSRGLFKSTDGGLTYTRKESGITEGDGLTIRNFFFDPTNSNTLFVSAEYSVGLQGEEFDRAKGLVYKSSNGGDTWTKVLEIGSLARWMCINPSNPSRMNVFTGIFDREAFDTTGDGVMHSDDGGATWTKFNTGITGSLFVGGMAMEPDPFTGTIIIGTGQYTEMRHGTLGGLFKTTNGGANWTRVLAPQTPDAPGSPDNSFTAVAFAPSNRQIVYAGNALAIYRSADNGATWTRYGGPTSFSWGAPGIRSGVPIEITVDRDDVNTVFINNYGGGTFKSTDGGKTWAVLGRGFTGADIHKVAVSLQSRALALLVGRSGPFKTTNGGADWPGLFYADATQTSEWYGAAAHPTNPAVLYVTDEHQGFIYRSADGGSSWRSVYKNPGATASTVDTRHGAKEIIVLGGATETVYAGYAAANLFSNPDATYANSFGVYKSTDAGATWTAKNSGLEGTTLNIMALVAGRTDGSVLYAGLRGGGVYRSANGGDSWSNITGAITAPKGVFSLAVSPTDANTVYAGTHSGGLYKTTNGGTSWALVLAANTTTASSAALGFEPELGHFPRTAAATAPRIFFALAINPTNASDVWAADWNSGVYRSTDAGATWSQLNTGLTNRAVQTLAFSADGIFVYAGTKGDGVFRFQTAAATDTGPSITTPPASAAVAAGAGTTLTVAASGTVPLSYQWYKNGVAISGATSATLTLASFQSGDVASYTVTVLNSAGLATSSAAQLTLAAPPNPGRLINLSILTGLAVGETMTVGTVVGGAGTGGAKPLLIRAVGPTLAAFGIGDALPDPDLTVLNGQTQVAANDNWGGAGGGAVTTLNNAFTQVGAFAFASSASKDAAVFFSPAITSPANYVIQVRGNGTSGSVLAELYDATPAGAFNAGTPRLVNVSVLKQIPAGGALTAGFVVGGAANLRVLVRAVGPTLGQAPFGIGGVMADPKLELFNNATGTKINENNDWAAPVAPSTATAAQLAATFTAVGAFQLSGPATKDAVLLVTLVPGQYSARVTAADGGGGLALVEVYEVP